MKLSLNINGADDRIEILTPAPACRFRIGDGSEREAHVEAPEPGVYSILMGGYSYDARVEERPGGGVVVVIDGFRFEIDVHDPRRWTRKSAGRGDAGIQRITAPMPGKVVRVLISPGETVEAGQGL
jgi:biotin carboxyl carrier protein